MNYIRSKAGTSKRDQTAALHERLRQGDPALDLSALRTDEIQEIRRAMLCATPESRPRAAWWTPLRAGATLGSLGGVAALLLALSLWRAPNRAPRLASRPADRYPAREVLQRRLAASVPAPTTPGPERRRNPSASGGSRQLPAPRSRPSPERLAAQGPRARPQDGAPGTAPAVASTTTPVPVSGRREMHFSSPGGTRIVWVFASGDAPTSETPLPSRL